MPQTTAPPLGAQIEDVMECFRFKKVERIMAAEKWCLGESNDPPSKHTLRGLAHDLLKCAAAAPDGHLCHAGPFVCLKVRGVLHLIFAVEQWDGSLPRPAVT